MMNTSLIKHLESVLQCTIHKTAPIQGGDINDSYRIYTDGGSLMVKTNQVHLKDMFEKEYRGLELLAGTSSIRVPKPVTTGTHGQEIYLVMEWLEKAAPGNHFWQQFAADLAGLHRNTAETFGLDHDNYIGSLPQRNQPTGTWADFYATNRILALVKSAYDQQCLQNSEVRMAERLCNRLQDLFPSERPALLHGDLWSGNYMCTANGTAAVFDPAVYYGHREMDLGMMLLVGGFDRLVFDYYDACWPLEKDWRSRTPLTQLYPLLVHLVLFGGHYHASVKQVLKRFS